VSVDFDSSKQRWRVRRREDGRQKSRRFRTEAEAIEFDASLRSAMPQTAIYTRASHRQDLGLLEACADYYRPLAEFLIGAGTRISEEITTRETGKNLGPRLIEAIQKLGYDPERSLGLCPDFQQRKLFYAWAKP
jgi:hypothetical protein